jgi:hypothetical protein
MSTDDNALLFEEAFSERERIISSIHAKAHNIAGHSECTFSWSSESARTLVALLGSSLNDSESDSDSGFRQVG